MATLAASLDMSLRNAGIPIIGVSIGSLKDRQTWVVQFSKEATPQQRLQANDIVAAFNPNDTMLINSIKTGEAILQFDSELSITAAVITALAGRLGRNPTLEEIATERDRFISIYKTL